MRVGLGLALALLAGSAMAQTELCGSSPNPAADMPPNPNYLRGDSSEFDAIAAINNARASERLGPLVLPATYLQLTADQRVFLLVNQERTARGLAAFPSNDANIAATAARHSLVLAQNPSLFPAGAHANAIDGDPVTRLEATPGVSGHWRSLGEIVAINPFPAGAVYEWMYADAGSQWGHREDILGANGACFTDAGFGHAEHGTFDEPVFTGDFIASAPWNPYVPPR